MPDLMNPLSLARIALGGVLVGMACAGQAQRCGDSATAATCPGAGAPDLGLARTEQARATTQALQCLARVSRQAQQRRRPEFSALDTRTKLPEGTQDMDEASGRMKVRAGCSTRAG